MPRRYRRATSSSQPVKRRAVRPPRTAPRRFQNISTGRRRIPFPAQPERAGSPAAAPRSAVPMVPSHSPGSFLGEGGGSANAASRPAGGRQGLPAPFPETKRGRAGRQRRPSAAKSGQARPCEARRGEAARRRHRGRSPPRRCRPRPGPPPGAAGVLRGAAPPPDPLTRSPPPG